MNSDETVRHLVWTHWELICQWMNCDNLADQLKMILITYEKKNIRTASWLKVSFDTTGSTLTKI